jgi:hypothetical protein
MLPSLQRDTIVKEPTYRMLITEYQTALTSVQLVNEFSIRNSSCTVTMWASVCCLLQKLALSMPCHRLGPLFCYAVVSAAMVSVNYWNVIRTVISCCETSLWSWDVYIHWAATCGGTLWNTRCSWPLARHTHTHSVSETTLCCSEILQMCKSWRLSFLTSMILCMQHHWKGDWVIGRGQLKYLERN